MKFRKGFSLIEVSIALAIASAMMTYTYSTLSSAIKMKQEAKFLNTAVFLAKLKMAQFDASSSLEEETSDGNIPGYKGFSFSSEVKEEELDLFELSGMEEGEKPPTDLLGGEDSELNKVIKERNAQQDFKTAGLINVFKIKISIFYQIGNQKKEYSIETFKPTKF